MDWLAAILELTGLWIVGNKRRVGFLVNLACNITWIVYVLSSGKAQGLLLVVIPAIVVNLRNYLRWSQMNGDCYRHNGKCGA